MVTTNGSAVHARGPTGNVLADPGAVGEDGTGEAGATGAGQLQCQWRDDHGLIV